MPLNIKLSSGLPHFELRALLDGVTYTIELRWNVRAGFWFIRVLNEQADTVLIADKKLVANWPIAAYITGRQPPGAFVCIDTSGAGADPGFDDFAARHQLWYFTAGELGL